jgi:hypothetical protein
MPFYFDESIHQRGDFILGAYVYGPDPTNDINAALAAVGLDPERDEFKSSARMTEHPEQQALRGELHKILHMRYSYAVVVIPRRERGSLGAEALLGLRKICQANSLTRRREPAYFDKGVFASARRALEIAERTEVAQYCEIHAEQDSRCVKGLQLADLVAHTCATMLLGGLGLLSKVVKAGPNSGYDPDLGIELGLELWASVRYQFFNGGLPDSVQSNEDMVVEVAPYGLHIAESCSPNLRQTALDRFGRQYLGCIH